MKIQPSKAIENGFTAQLTNRVTPMPRACCRTSCRRPKSIFTSIGTIITQISSPTGRFTRANSSPETMPTKPGATCPRPTPAAMHNATHSVR